MIVYNLRCDGGHEFEGWFQSGATFDEQAATGKLMCPMCASHKVEKAIMAPAVTGTRKSVSAKDELKKMRQFVSGMRKYV